jgi:hypothetical protein
MKEMKSMKGQRTKLDVEVDPVQVQLVRSQNSILHALHALHGAIRPVSSLCEHSDTDKGLLQNPMVPAGRSVFSVR